MGGTRRRILEVHDRGSQWKLARIAVTSGLESLASDRAVLWGWSRSRRDSSTSRQAEHS
jgi:hypothetical protein